ncbi:hypothetical protein ACQ4LE_009269 [Meloidogyne hapla]|uniref:Ig-like_bact domain-containing protein n=1 Tax=Meloidogyne hapla TaxID=6305 RepID=A0A1I8B3Q8_MELHA
MSQLDYPQYPILKKEEDSTLVCTLSKTVNTAKTSGVSTAEVLSPSSEIQTTALTQENISVVSDKLEIVLNNSEKATITDGKSEKTISDLIGEKKSLTFSY